MTELKTCPFCGGKPTAIETHPGRGELYCGKCDLVMCGDNAKTPEELTQAWNTRHVETCKLNELDALTQTLSMVDGCAWGECSECGCLTPDDSTYCINCGRKVVSE